MSSVTTLIINTAHYHLNSATIIHISIVAELDDYLDINIAHNKLSSVCRFGLAVRR